MKKYFIGLTALVLAIGASAFTTITNTLEGTYYRDGNTIVLITTQGVCDSGSNFCTYTLKAGQPDNGDPVNYDGVGTEDKQWIP